jgi:hypothetical protein
MAAARARVRSAALRWTLALCACAALAGQAGHAWAAMPHARSRSGPPTLPVSVMLPAPASEAGEPVPQSFLGLSFEVAALPQLAGYARRGDLVTLLRSLGPGVLRFGGVTADEDIAWGNGAMPRPAWASGVVEAGNLGELAALSARSGWHVLLTVGFGHYEPEAGAQEAAAAKALLGSSLDAIELGNEPDAYARHGLRADPWTFVQYDEQVASYRHSMEALAGPIPLAGPDTSGSGAYEKWGLWESIYQRPALLTGHHYPLGCHDDPPPSIPLLLSPRIRELEERSLRHYLLVAQQSELPFRLDETNTVSCGGVAGISNTFASALWALGLITKAMSLGVAGVNFQGNPTNCVGYTPLCAYTPQQANAGELQAQPEWYALLMARALLGERPLRTRVLSPDHANLVESAFVASDGALRFVLVDDDPPGSDGVAVRLHVGGAFHGASVLSLSAPSPQATSGVSLDGEVVSASGTFTQPAKLPTVRNRHGVITVDLRPSSAALVTVSPRAHAAQPAGG